MPRKLAATHGRRALSRAVNYACRVWIDLTPRPRSCRSPRAAWPSRSCAAGIAWRFRSCAPPIGNGGSAIAAMLALPAVAGKFGLRGGGFTMSQGGAFRVDEAHLLGAT